MTSLMTAKWPVGQIVEFYESLRKSFLDSNSVNDFYLKRFLREGLHSWLGAVCGEGTSAICRDHVRKKQSSDYLDTVENDDVIQLIASMTLNSLYVTKAAS